MPVRRGCRAPSPRRPQEKGFPCGGRDRSLRSAADERPLRCARREPLAAERRHVDKAEGPGSGQAGSAGAAGSPAPLGRSNRRPRCAGLRAGLLRGRPWRGCCGNRAPRRRRWRPWRPSPRGRWTWMSACCSGQRWGGRGAAPRGGDGSAEGRWL